MIKTAIKAEEQVFYKLLQMAQIMYSYKIKGLSHWYW